MIMEHSFTKVIDLLYLAKLDGIEIVLNGDKLQLKVPENQVVDQDLLAQIRSNKATIIEFLSNNNWKSRHVARDYNRISRFDRSSVLQVPLSFSQERLWFIDQLEGSVQYHAPVVLRLKGTLDTTALGSALRLIVDRHEVLRTVYRQQDGQVFQYIREGRYDWKLQIVSGSQYQNDAAGLVTYVERLVRAPFDLSADYMLRATLVVISELEHLLVVTMHHIASDAWSLNIIVKEVVRCTVHSPKATRCNCHRWTCSMPITPTGSATTCRAK